MIMTCRRILGMKEGSMWMSCWPAQLGKIQDKHRLQGQRIKMKWSKRYRKNTQHKYKHKRRIYFQQDRSPHLELSHPSYFSEHRLNLSLLPCSKSNLSHLSNRIFRPSSTLQPPRQSRRCPLNHPQIGPNSQLIIRQTRQCNSWSHNNSSVHKCRCR